MQIVTAALLYNDGKYLLCQRPATDKLSLKWEFPGGKLEAGETPEAALKRELREELNITPDDFYPALRLEHAYPEFKITLHVFMVNAFSGEPAALDKQTLAWLLPSEATSLPFLAADVPIVEKLAAGELA